MSDTDTRSVLEIMGWRYGPWYDLDGPLMSKPAVKKGGRRITVEPDDGPQVDDMLAWLKRNVSTVRIDPIRCHETGYTVTCTDETEPMQPNRVVVGVSAETLHAALEAAVRAVAEAER